MNMLGAYCRGGRKTSLWWHLPDLGRKRVFILIRSYVTWRKPEVNGNQGDIMAEYTGTREFSIQLKLDHKKVLVVGRNTPARCGIADTLLSNGVCYVFS